MKLLRVWIPNLAISLNLAMVIVVYLDMRNPMMGFLSGAPFPVLVGCACLCSVLSAATLYGDWRKKGNRGIFAEKNLD